MQRRLICTAHHLWADWQAFVAAGGVPAVLAAMEALAGQLPTGQSPPAASKAEAAGDGEDNGPRALLQVRQPELPVCQVAMQVVCL